MRVMLVDLTNDFLLPPGHSWIGGGQVGIYDLARWLLAVGDEVALVTRATQRTAQSFERLGTRSSIIRVRVGPSHVVRPRSLIQHAEQLIERAVQSARTHRVQSDVVHSQYWIGGVFGTRWARAVGVRHVHFLLSAGRLAEPEGQQRDPERDAFELEAYQGSDALIAQSNFVARRFRVLYPEVDPAKLHTVLHGTDPRLFCPRPYASDDYVRWAATRLA